MTRTVLLLASIALAAFAFLIAVYLRTIGGLRIECEPKL